MIPIKSYLRQIDNMAHRSMLMIPVWYMEYNIFSVGDTYTSNYVALPFTKGMKFAIGDISNLFGALDEIEWAKRYDSKRYNENVAYFAQQIYKYGGHMQ